MDGRDAPVAEGMPRAATAIAVTAWGTAVLAVVLAVAARAPVDEALWFFAVDVTVACVYGTVAPVILARRRHPVPWILALAAVGGGLAALGFAYKAFAIDRGGLPAAEAIGSLQGLAWVPGTLALFLVVPWLVRDHPLGRAVWGVVAGGALIVVLVAAQALGVDVLFSALISAVVILGLVSAAAVEWRHRRGPVAERNGLGWLALGTAVLALSFVPLALPWGLLSIPVWVTPVLHLASQAVYPAAVLVAVLRGRMWGLQLAVSRTVLAGLMTVTLTTTYVVVTWLVTRVVPGSGFGQLVGAAVVAVAVQPARLWLERRVHRLVHGTAATPDHVVRRLGSHLSVEGSAEGLLRGLAEDVGTAMRLESVTLVVPGADDDVVWGMPSGTPLSVSLRHRGEEVGSMLVTLPGGESLGSAGQRTLADLANVVATAVAVTRAAREVEESRQRLASARLAERRVIRREIHDGLGPSLAGLRLGLRGARNLLETDPAAAAALLRPCRTSSTSGSRRCGPSRTACSHRCWTSSVWGPPSRSSRPATPRTASRCGSTCTTRRSRPAGGSRRLRHHRRGAGQRQPAQRGERVHRAHDLVGGLAHRARLRPRSRHHAGRPGGRRKPVDARARRGAGGPARDPLGPGRGNVRRGSAAAGGVPACLSSRPPGPSRSGSRSSTTTRCSGSGWRACSARSTASSWSPRRPTRSRPGRSHPGSVDVVLMDLHLGEDSGIETTRELVRRDPDVRVLVVTMREDDESVVASMRVGARGYLLKGASPEEVERAVRAVANGEVILGPAVAARAVAALTSGRTSARVPFPELTDREREVLDLVARGYDNLTIARRLVLSPKTVRNNVSNVLTKLGASDRSAAIVTGPRGRARRRLSVRLPSGARPGLRCAGARWYLATASRAPLLQDPGPGGRHVGDDPERRAGERAPHPAVTSLPAPVAPTPRLELSVGTAVARYLSLASALPGTAIHYAVKANPHPVLLRALAQAGCRFDVASPAEVRVALEAGAAASHLVHSNPVARRDHLAEAYALGVRLFVVDSAGEVAKLAEAAPGSSVLVRIVTSGSGSDWPLSRKYGCTVEDAVELLVAAGRLGLDPAGCLVPRRLAAAQPPRLGRAHRVGRPGVRRCARRRPAPVAARPRRRVPGPARR